MVTNTLGFSIWLTGLPSSGKTTIGIALAKKFLDLGFRIEVLDGDELRQALSPDLGFSAADRKAHNLRVIYLAKLLNRNNIVTVVPIISPFRSTRRHAREELGRFIEVYVNCPIEECIRRDIKGLYRKAIAGEIQNFTGISDPYEPPRCAEVIVDTNVLTVEECVERITTSSLAQYARWVEGTEI